LWLYDLPSSRIYVAGAEYLYSLGDLEGCERQIKLALWRGKEWSVGDGQPDRWGRDDLRSLGLLAKVLAQQRREADLSHIIGLIKNIDSGYAETVRNETDGM
jgi:hypothetical protein